MKPPAEVNPEKIDPDAPLRLEHAVKVAFPMGGMTVSGLRTEIERKRLSAERIAGKLFTTLRDIERMRRLCREEAEAPISGSEKRGATAAELSHINRPGSSGTENGTSSLDALKATARRLKES